MTDAHVFANGRVFTGLRFAEALLLEGDRVSTVGSRDAVLRETPTGAEVHDLAGGLLIPGLIDAHLHLADVTRDRESFDARRAPSWDALVEQLRDWSAAHPSGALVGGGWEAEQFREGRSPDRATLDRAVADRPVVLYHTSGHAAAVNSVALSTAGIGRATPDPPNGRVDRASDGSPTGLLYEAAVRPVAAVVAAAFPPDPVSIHRMLHEMASLGLTTVATMNASRAEISVVRELAGGPGLPVRVRAYLRLADLDGLGPEDLDRLRPDGWFALRGVKAFTDGAFGPRTAWLTEPYADAPAESGVPATSPEGLVDALGRAIALDLAPAVHAIGDRAVGFALRVFEGLPGPATAPSRIEHAALTPPDVLAALDRSRPALVVQPGFVWSDHWLAARLGRGRARWAYAFRTLRDRGVLLAGSSDAPYDSLDPWRGLRACLDRRDPRGRSGNPETGEALPAEEALVLYTRHGGAVLGESDLGNLEPGARADLVWTAAKDPLSAIRAGHAALRETWVGGRPVFRRA